jgi:predicted RND superfamily exporter protein
MEPFRRRIPSIILDHPYLWFSLFFLLTVASGYGITRLRIDNSVEVLLEKDTPVYRAFQKFTELFGNAELAVVSFSDPLGILRPEVLGEIAELTEAIEKRVPHVVEVISLTNAHVLDRLPNGDLVVRPLIDMEKGIPTDPEALKGIFIRAKEEPFFRKTLISEDGATTSLIVRIPYRQEDPLYRRELTKGLLQVIEEFQKKYHRNYYLAGPPVFLTYFDDYILRDLMIFAPLVVLTVVVILFVTYRTVFGVALPLLVVLVGFLWTLGFMGIMGFPITLATTIIPPLLIVTGVEDSIYILSFYQKNLLRSQDRRGIAHLTSEETFVPCFYTSITTAVGFGSLAITRIEAVYETGIVSAVGTMLLWLANNVLLVLLLRFLPPPRRAGEVEKIITTGFLARFLNRILDYNLRVPRRVFLFGIGFALLFLPGISFVRVETNFVRYFHESSPIVIAHQFLEKHLSGVAPLEILVDSGKPEGIKDPLLLQEIYRIEEALKGEPTVDWVYSPADFVLTLHRSFSGSADLSSHSFPVTSSELIQQYFFLYEIAGGGAGVENFLTSDGRYGRISARLKDVSTRHLKETIQKITGIMDEVSARTGARLSFADNTTMLVALVDSLFQNTLNSLMLATVVIFILIYLYIRNLRVALLFMIPNLVPILAVLGLMGYAGIDLNISTMMIGSVAIGLAVNNTIHIFAHFPESLIKHSFQLNDAAHETMHSVGRAAVSTGVALMGGFLILTLSNFYPNFYFGTLSAFTLLVALICDLTISFTIWIFLAKKGVGLKGVPKEGGAF